MGEEELKNTIEGLKQEMENMQNLRLSEKDPKIKQEIMDDLEKIKNEISEKENTLKSQIKRRERKEKREKAKLEKLKNDKIKYHKLKITLATLNDRKEEIQNLLKTEKDSKIINEMQNDLNTINEEINLINDVFQSLKTKYKLNELENAELSQQELEKEDPLMDSLFGEELEQKEEESIFLSSEGKPEPELDVDTHSSFIDNGMLTPEEIQSLLRGMDDRQEQDEDGFSYSDSEVSIGLGDREDEDRKTLIENTIKCWKNCTEAEKYEMLYKDKDFWKDITDKEIDDFVDEDVAFFIKYTSHPMLKDRRDSFIELHKNWKELSDEEKFDIINADRDFVEDWLIKNESNEPEPVVNPEEANKMWEEETSQRAQKSTEQDERHMTQDEMINEYRKIIGIWENLQKDEFLESADNGIMDNFYKVKNDLLSLEQKVHNLSSEKYINNIYEYEDELNRFKENNKSVFPQEKIDNYKFYEFNFEAVRNEAGNLKSQEDIAKFRNKMLRDKIISIEDEREINQILSECKERVKSEREEEAKKSDKDTKKGGKRSKKGKDNKETAENEMTDLAKKEESRLSKIISKIKGFSIKDFFAGLLSKIKSIPSKVKNAIANKRNNKNEVGNQENWEEATHLTDIANEAEARRKNVFDERYKVDLTPIPESSSKEKDEGEKSSDGMEPGDE